MSPAIIQVNMLSGRYHAHPWGEAQHAMAGPEWPPSPWRLLRTIAACWFDAVEPPCSPEQRDSLIEKLGRSGAPTIWIPSASFNELPFYHPITLDKAEKLPADEAKISGKKTRSVREANARALHFDHFAVLAAPSIYFIFDVQVHEEDRSWLSAILSKGRYFGRAESRASFCLTDENVQKPDGYHEAKAAEKSRCQDDAIRRSVLVATTDFKASDLWQVRQAEKAKAKPKAQSIANDHPTHLVEALINARKAVPDGTKWVQYELPRATIVHELPKRTSGVKRHGMRPAAEVLFRLFRRIPIPVADTVLIARDFRDQAVRAYGAATGRQTVLLSGREENGSISHGHRHAFYLPQPGRDGGLLEHIVVRLPGGESGVEQEILDALLGVMRLWRHDRYPVLVVAEGVRATPTISGLANAWRSLTPFLGPLHHKPSRNSTEPREQLLNALAPAVGIEPNRIETSVVPVLSHLYGSSKDGASRHYRFVRRAGTCFTLEFSQSVQFPLAIGADSHFGLGQFEPVHTASSPSDGGDK
ncbi:MAG TPA: type I-U CRISPR-associated protein Csb2 [Xanthobacteraceae bacterium]|nr:type I-U CRISPR-associated protein Csb2 [Xanthobacteraceae bacterium]